MMECCSVSSFTPPPRRRKPPAAGSFFVPPDLTGDSLVAALSFISGDIARHRPSAANLPLQRRNSRSLRRRAELLLSLFDPIYQSPELCLKELFIILNRAQTLLNFCSRSSRLWLLLKTQQISYHFHDLAVDLATVLDVLPPAGELGLTADAMDHVELLRKQARGSKLFVDPGEESLRLKVLSFLEGFEKGVSPDSDELLAVFVNGLGIRDAGACRSEIELLEEHLSGAGDDQSLIGTLVALARFAMLTAFDGKNRSLGKMTKKGIWVSGIIVVPKDFCCPISLEIMADPVVVSTGQTYDRASIVKWMEEGRSTCPSSGQSISSKRFVPNRSLKNLITQWFAGNDAGEVCPERSPESRAAAGANRATAAALVRLLETGSPEEKTFAACELRVLARSGKENRIFIAELGGIPLLAGLLCNSSGDPVAQENAVTAILNISIHDVNKARIMAEEGCLSSIVAVLRRGSTEEARENAAATLFSLSAVHGHKERIAGEFGAVEALAELLAGGSRRGKKDAVSAMFNLSTHPDCWERMMAGGAVAALVGALAGEEDEDVAEDAAAAIAMLAKRPEVSEAIAGEDSEAVAMLIGMLRRRGSSRGKESAVAALHEICRRGGEVPTRKVARSPALGGILQGIFLTGTKRARRKAASLARICQRCDCAAALAAIADAAAVTARGNSAVRSSGGFAGDVPAVSVLVPISVPVL